jgi:hypothetical protein
MRSKLDWSATDLEHLKPDAIPVTGYKPIGDRLAYAAAYTQWPSGPARAYYRIAWRAMAANVGERTLIAALIPPGATHPHTVSSMGLPGDSSSLCLTAGVLSSILLDFAIRAVPKSGIQLSSIKRLPLVVDHPLRNAILLRVLRANCLTNAYAELWREAYRDDFTGDRWAYDSLRTTRPELGIIEPTWTAETPLRIAEDRRQALVEIDALVAVILGVTADELCTVYRTQFAVLYGYDHHDYVYDMNGRLVPNSVLTTWRDKGDSSSVEDRTAANQAGYTYTYDLPFRILDREADMRTAYAEFERRLAAL